MERSEQTMTTNDSSSSLSADDDVRVSASTREIPIRDALKEAMWEEMDRDSRVFLVGEEVGAYNGAYKCSKGMLEHFGAKRVIDAPIAESGFAGIGVGAAFAGLRPIVEFMTFNFSLVAIDQILNSAAKAHMMSAGALSCPIVFRGAGGAAYQLGAQHANSLEGFYAYTPGLIVIAPSTPYDMKGLLKSAIRNDDPVVFIESELTYSLKGPVPDEEYLIPIGKADFKRRGDDLTIISWSKNVFLALEVADTLKGEGIDADVIDLRTLRPLDEEAILSSVRRTNRVLIIQEQHEISSYGSYLSHLISTKAFDYLDAPVMLVSSLEAPMPYSKPLEAVVLPSKSRCVEAAKSVLR
jgi:pyruvate dehydrogenase E1 component beta subunit